MVILLLLLVLVGLGIAALLRLLFEIGILIHDTEPCPFNFLSLIELVAHVIVLSAGGLGLVEAV